MKPNPVPIYISPSLPTIDSSTIPLYHLIMPKYDNSGMTLVETLIAASLVMVLALAATALITYSRKEESRIKKYTESMQLIGGVGAQLMQKTSTEVLNYCNDNSRMDQPVATSKCKMSSDGSLTTTVTPSSNTVDCKTTFDKSCFERDLNLGLRVNWQGQPNASGTACVEIYECFTRIQDQLYEIVLQVYWKPPAEQALATRTFSVWRSRW